MTTRLNSNAAIALIQRLLAEVGPRTTRGIGYLLTARRSEFMPDGPEGRMSDGNLKRLGGWCTKARRDGRIPWDWILEEGRRLEGVRGQWESIRDFLEYYAEHPPTLNHWASQPHDVELWCEKATLAGILRPAAHDLGVGYRSVHGSVSETTIHKVSLETLAQQRPRIILYFGDHDPKGVEMSQDDLPTRFALACHTFDGKRPPITITRVAVTLAQLRQPSLRPYRQPVKEETDKSAGAYIRRYHTRWGLGLDALDPEALPTLVMDAIRDCIVHPRKWKRSQREQFRQAQLVTKAFARLARRFPSNA